MRVGNNPNKGIGCHSLRPVVLGVVTHLPNQEGYHARRMEVVQTCLRSMTQNAGQPISLIVWDNGSCPALLDWIEQEIKPDVLVRSMNVGKTTARSMLCRMLHPDMVLAYSDDDMYFFPGWLEPQLKLMEHFPNVAAVSGYPTRTAFRWGIGHTVKWALENGKLEYGRFLPDRYEDDFAISLGRDPIWHRDYTAKDIDYRVTYNGVQAYCTAHHCQFVGQAGTLGRVIQFESKSLADEKPFDEALDEIGLRLSTIERYARHMGNMIDHRLREEIFANVEI